MTWESSFESAPLAPEAARHVDDICTRYERAWKRGDRPRIEDLLDVAAEAERPALLRELIALEVELRLSHSADSKSGEYRERFHGQAAVVDAALTATVVWPESNGTRPTQDGAPRGLSHVAVGCHGDQVRRHDNQRRPAVPRLAGSLPWRAGGGVRGAGLGAEPRGRPQADPRPLRRRADEPAAVPPRGRDHRRARAPGDRPRLRPGNLRRRPAILRHEVRQGGQPQGRNHPVPRRGGLDPRYRSPVDGAEEADSAVPRRLQHNRVRPRPGRAPPRHQARQRDRRQARRDDRPRLGHGQGDGPARPDRQ